MSGAHEPVTPRDCIMYDGILYDGVNEESDNGPIWGRVNVVHEPVIPKDNMIIRFDDHEIEIDREGDRDRMREIEIDRKNNRYLFHSIEINQLGERYDNQDWKRFTYMEYRWQSAAAA